MKTYKQLEEEFAKEVKKLQSKCKHKNLTKWLKRNWIKDSDTSGNAIKICKFCNKLLRFGNVKKYKKIK